MKYTNRQLALKLAVWGKRHFPNNGDVLKTADKYNEWLNKDTPQFKIKPNDK